MIEEAKLDNKRFLCFGAYMYEAYGGIDDIRETFDTKEEALKWLTGDSGYEIRKVYDRIDDISYFINS